MLSQFSVKRPYTVIVAVVLVIVLGVISYMGMRTDLLPEIELPYVVVVTAYPGSQPGTGGTGGDKAVGILPRHRQRFEKDQLDIAREF